MIGGSIVFSNNQLPIIVRYVILCCFKLLLVLHQRIDYSTRYIWAIDDDAKKRPEYIIITVTTTFK